MSISKPEPHRPRRSRVGRLAATTASVAVHAGLIVLLFGAYAGPPATPEPPPVSVTLFDGLPPSPKPDPEPPAAPKPAPIPDPPPKTSAIRKARIPPRVASLAAEEEPADETVVSELSDAQLGGARTAGAGPTGTGCNMVRALQNALRRDRMVQAAVAEVHNGKALLVWNGDWVRSPGQEGKGLAAVRQAIMWEVAFSPEACRTEPVRGLVLISLADTPGSARVAVGGGQWRWSDLVGVRR